MRLFLIKDCALKKIFKKLLHNSKFYLTKFKKIRSTVYVRLNCESLTLNKILLGHDKNVKDFLNTSNHKYYFFFIYLYLFNKEIKKC
jgi:hypothetical protein